jgi:hypothetical protein
VATDRFIGDRGDEISMILNCWGANELEAEQIAVRAGPRPHDLGLLDGLVVGRSPHPKRAYLANGHGHVDRYAKAADARVDCEPRAAHWRQEIDFGVERPASRTTPRSSMNGNVCTASRKHRREPIGNGSQGTADSIQTAAS